MKSSEFEAYGEDAKRMHGGGHGMIGNGCIDDHNHGKAPAMRTYYASARDPIFYRWHTFLEDLIQDWRNYNTPK